MGNGQFEKGNQFWKARSKHGRDMLFASPSLLWEAACEYFEWCDENPLYEEKGFAFQGVVTKEKFAKLRAYTMSGLCLFLDCSENYFRAFKSTQSENKTDFITIIEKIESTIYNQKFVGAAADQLNPNIIARELGLSDKSDAKVTNYNVNIEPTPEEAKAIKEAYDSSI